MWARSTERVELLDEAHDFYRRLRLHHDSTPTPQNPVLGRQRARLIAVIAALHVIGIPVSRFDRMGRGVRRENLPVAATRRGSACLRRRSSWQADRGLATSMTASLRDSPWIALGDVMGANIAICLVALGVGALIAPLPSVRPSPLRTSAFRWV